MSSSPLAAGPARRTAGARRASPTGLRRVTQIVLVTGSVLAAAAALGPPWATRIGLVVAVASAVVACVLAWRELSAVERRHAGAMLQASQRHGQQLREEREHNASVVEALRGRVQQAMDTIGVLRTTIGSLRHQVFTLEGDRASLRGELQQRERVIGSLRSTVRTQDTTIRGLEERLRETVEEPGASEPEPAEAEVHHMPRRVRTELDAASQVEAVDRRTMQTAFAAPAVLPNYEEDRRLA